ncbi:DUF4012 domain-containing protein, partial [Patescibacteria group bacterium]|nr:DUF4012 domain-containing protein [Patescibacteria group bacterium]MBU1870640.1 DUF4012 domain-containing protein [Patescibacteria group bacterium]
KLINLKNVKIEFHTLLLAKKKLIHQLAFICFFKFTFKSINLLITSIYKTCFYSGWITLFLIRFFYFASIILIKLIIKPIKSLITFINKLNYSTWFNQRLIIKKFLPRPNLFYLRSVIIFALVLLILILPFKAYTYYKSLDTIRGQVLKESKQAINQLLFAGKSAVDLDFNQTQINFSQAGNNFLSAQDKLNEINGLLFTLAAIIPDKNLQLTAVAKDILQAGQLSSEIGKNLSMIIEKSFNKTNGLKEILDNFRLYGRLAASKTFKLNNLLTTIDNNNLPDQYSQQFILLQEKTKILNNSLTEFVDLADKLDNFLGLTQNKRYLLVFQNNTELRASGGFIGSYALLDFSNGKLKNLEVPGGGSYDTKAGMLAKIIAPQPLQLIAPQWYFWDANWWFDWPTSANKLMWFYEKSNGPTVDGVISFTPTVLEELLKIIGPIDLTEQYNMIIDADNFWLKTQELVEQKTNKTNQPKKIINDLMNKIIAELPTRITKNNLIPLLKVTEQLFSAKQILFYFTDSDLQNKIVKLGWDGGFKKTDKDYLAVINTNIAGGKSDRKIQETIDHQAKVMPDNTIIDTVTIKRTHTGIKNELFCGVRNIDWMRIYVPQGSQLISAQGFQAVDEIYFKKPDNAWQTDLDIYKTESQTIIDKISGTKIYNEFNKTVFANWSQVNPGQTITIILKYKLPFRINESIKSINESITDKIINKALDLINQNQKKVYPYSLLIQKQPGAKIDQITANLIVNNFSLIWKYPTELVVNKTGWQINNNLDSDKFWAVLLEEK